jgi:hypothetical protein
LLDLPKPHGTNQDPTNRTRLGVKRSRVQIPAARLESAGHSKVQVRGRAARPLGCGVGPSPRNPRASQSSEPAHSRFLRRPGAVHRRRRTGRRPWRRQRRRGHPGTDGRRSAGRWPGRGQGRPEDATLLRVWIHLPHAAQGATRTLFRGHRTHPASSVSGSPRWRTDQSDAEGDAEVREALSHCPQCGSGHFTECRAD